MQNQNILEKEPVGKLLWRLSLPSIFAEIVNMLYSMIDRMFVGRSAEHGAAFLAALGVTVPVLYIVSAFAEWVGSGGGPYVAIAFGKKQEEEGREIFENCCTLLAVLAVFLTIIFWFFSENILRFLGAEGETLHFAGVYLRIYVLGTIFVLLSVGLVPFMVTQGQNRISMRNTCIGAISNVILDAVFVYFLKGGLVGAAIATVMSQGITAGLNLSFFLSPKSVLKWKFAKLDFKILFQPMCLGFTTFFMCVTESLVQSVYNKQLLLYGNADYVAAMSIVYSLSQIIINPVVGIGQGAQPIVSYNYGAGNTKRVFMTIQRSVLSCSIYALLCAGAMITGLEKIFALFTTDGEVIRIGVHGFSIFVIGKIMNGIQISIQDIFRHVGFVKTGIFNAAVRKFVLILPLALLLPKVGSIGVDGVFWAETIADVLAVFCAAASFFLVKSRLLSKMGENRGIRIME